MTGKRVPLRLASDAGAHRPQQEGRKVRVIGRLGVGLAGRTTRL
jgi:hypothetical protein